MSMNESRYRALIVASFCCLGLSVIASVLGQRTLPADLHAYLVRSSADTSLVAGIAGGVYLIAVAASGLGLFLFKSWARSLALALTLASIAFSPMLGPQVQTGLSGALLDAEVLSWGMVLALSYWSPLANRFV